MNKEQLEVLCGHSARPTISKPFSVQLEGKWWNGATNGHAVVIVETMSPDYLRENTPPVKDLFPVRKKVASHTLIVGALSDWLEACKMWLDCPACHGLGTHKCNCYYCEFVDGDTCNECEGDKGMWSQLAVRFQHVQFNRTLLARYLSPFRDSGIARLWLGKGELDPFEIRGDGWRVLVMPMKTREGDEEEMVPSGLIQVAS